MMPRDELNELTAYKTIGPFTESTVPSGLLREHNTKRGVWGLLEVESGEVRYVITEAGHEDDLMLTPERSGVIAPEHKHHLVLVGAVQFTVTFYKASE